MHLALLSQGFLLLLFFPDCCIYFDTTFHMPEMTCGSPAITNLTDSFWHHLEELNNYTRTVVEHLQVSTDIVNLNEF